MNMHTCPVCKEKFLPAPIHVYKTSPNAETLVCSYHCMLKYRKEHQPRRKQRRTMKDEDYT